MIMFYIRSLACYKELNTRFLFQRTNEMHMQLFQSTIYLKASENTSFECIASNTPLNQTRTDTRKSNVIVIGE